MKTILVTYPEFQQLPKGVRRMLVASEEHFFDEARSLSVREAGRLAREGRRKEAPRAPVRPGWWN